MSNLVITGSRLIKDEDVALGALFFYRFNIEDIKSVYVGCAKGVDEIFRNLCQEHNIPCRVFTADWDKFGNGAGLLRNMDMLKAAKAEFSVFGCDVLAIPCAQSKGTYHCIVKSHEMGFRVQVYTQEFHRKYISRWQHENGI